MHIQNSQSSIARNALFLYLRMFLMMGVTLYTSRVILHTLGVEDFGIYNVVAGIVVLFSFINGAMAIASQRFLSFSLGKNHNDEVNRVFSMSLTSHLFIAFIILFLAETIGLLLLSKMNFPITRLDAVQWAYHFAVFTCVANVLRVPYNAAIIAYERMSFYAFVSIIEVFLRLLVAYLLIMHKGDNLIFYSFLLFFVTILVNVAYKLYANIKIPTTKYSFYWDVSLFKQFISFSGWSLTGSLANVAAQQGINMLLNVFCGVLVNASVGISNQVMGAVGQFLGNFQTAFNPQLVKSYAAGDNDYFMSLIFKSSKFSYYLMFVFCLPAILYCPFLLEVWLGLVPDYAIEFSQLIIIYLLLDAISGPLWISVQATGRIKQYQLLMSFLILLNIPFAFFVLYLQYSPIYVFVGRVLFNIITLIARIIYLKRLILLPARSYVIQVLFPAFLVTVFSIPIPYFICVNNQTTWLSLIINTIISIVISILIILLVGVTKSERLFAFSLLSKYVKRL